MILGFTGTREGLSKEQRLALCSLFDYVSGGSVMHNGCCVGADEDACEIAFQFDLSVIGHPCNIHSMVSHTAMKKCIKVMPVELPLVRNRAIVDGCQMLVVCPKGIKEELRSGTWATYRYALEKGTDILVVFPKGNTKLILNGQPGNFVHTSEVLMNWYDEDVDLSIA